jgi:hypothetical protein
MNKPTEPENSMQAGTEVTTTFSNVTFMEGILRALMAGIAMRGSRRRCGERLCFGVPRCGFGHEKETHAQCNRGCAASRQKGGTVSKVIDDYAGRQPA